MGIPSTIMEEEESEQRGSQRDDASEALFGSTSRISMAVNGATNGNPPNHHGDPSKTKHHTRINSVGFLSASTANNERLVVVRYFLDRPGYGLHNSAARLWFHPPERCKPSQVQEFLQKQGIALPGLLVEVYLDKWESFMMLEACENNLIEFNFEDCTHRNPGILNIRLTDLVLAEQEMNLTGMKQPLPPQQQQEPPQRQIANTTPAGLFSFSIMVGLESTALMSKLIPDSVDPSFVLAWGPYMFFVGGLLQVLVAIFQVLRNNLYGATAFFGFGCFWFSNGLIVILNSHFAVEGTVAFEFLDNGDPWGFFFRQLFIFGFSAALLKQTFVMNRLSTTLISLLCLKILAAAFSGFNETMQWIQLGLGWLTSAFAFYVFLVEFTNGVYHREVFRTFKWSAENSPEEVFGAAGRTGTLVSKAARLRQAAYPNVQRVRGATVDETAAERGGSQHSTEDL